MGKTLTTNISRQDGSYLAESLSGIDRKAIWILVQVGHSVMVA